MAQFEQGNVEYIILAYLFNYLVVYRKNKLFGGILFVGLGILSIAVMTIHLSGDELTLMTGVAFTAFAGALINLIYDIVIKLKK